MMLYHKCLVKLTVFVFNRNVPIVADGDTIHQEAFKVILTSSWSTIIDSTTLCRYILTSGSSDSTKNVLNLSAISPMLSSLISVVSFSYLAIISVSSALSYPYVLLVISAYPLSCNGVRYTSFSNCNTSAKISFNCNGFYYRFILHF